MKSYTIAGALTLCFLSSAVLADDAKVETTEVKIESLTLNIPVTWKKDTKPNRMRKATYFTPSADGDKEKGELAISSFRGGGGGVSPNLVRWIGQFDSKDKKVKLTQGMVGKQKYYVANISGTYNKSTGGGPFAPGKKTPMKDHRMMAVILTVDGGQVFFLKLTGPDKSVMAQAKAFRKSFGGDSEKEEPYEL